jgi:alpha-beta hydrolase superfamily lysophospholipase
VPRPAEIGRHAGLAYTLWLPAEQPRAGVVVLHGAGSCKESHHDFARVLIADGFAAVVFDQRGHGESDGPMDGRVLEDVNAMASVLPKGLPIALRGSSMGGTLAILAAPLVDARAVIAICPASPEGLRRGLSAGRFSFAADVAALGPVLAESDLHDAVQRLDSPLLLLHAAGDEQVPVEHSQELATHFASATSRLIVVPGGHHRSIQHDAELQAVSLRFLKQALLLS